jgi:putative ABC transport system permease protein
MKFLRLAVRNAARNRRRAALTVLSIAIAIVAISVLQTILRAFAAGVEMADEARLVVREATSIMYQLPLAYRDRIASIGGVRSVTTANWFGGIYRDRKNFFPKFAVDAETYFPMYPEFGMPEDQYRAFLKDRKGCVIGKKLAAQYGFKVGDVIPIEGDIYPGAWEFNVRAIYEGRKKGADETMLVFHWKYLDESLPTVLRSKVGLYIVQLESPREAGRIAKRIDSEFENSPDKTLSETEKAFNTEFVRMMGNFGLLVRAIGGAVAFAILLVAANTMAMAARERTTEIAILKTLGFRAGRIAGLVVTEGLLLTLAGWGVGCGLAWLLCRGIEESFATFFPVFSLAPETIALSLGIAVLTGILASLLPALRAARLTIIGALREVA